MAEAHQLLGSEEYSREWYERALARDPMAMENIAVMRRQARIELQALGRPTGQLDDVFGIPRVAAFVGHMTDVPDRATPRFPEALQRAVGQAIRSRLQTLRIGYGFSSAARGSSFSSSRRCSGGAGEHACSCRFQLTVFCERLLAMVGTTGYPDPE